MIGELMHDTAFRIGGLVMDTYLPLAPVKILEIGAQDVNGSLRVHAPRNAEYIGLDFYEGEGVDIVVTGPADWHVADGHFDLVLASSVFEHDKAFWQTFLTMCTKAKPGGHIYVSAPSNGMVHRYPRDYWRFYPDAGLALAEFACGIGIEVSLVESFVAEREDDDWNDFCAIFRRGPNDAELNRDFVYKKIPSTNVLTWRSSVIINPTDVSQDTRLLLTAKEETQRWIRHSEHLTALHADELAARSGHASELTKAIEQRTHDITTLQEVVACKDAELYLRSQHISELAHAIEQKESCLADLEEVVRAKDKELELHSRQIFDITQVIAEKTLRLSELYKIAAGQNDQLETLAHELDEKRSRIAFLDEAAVTKDEELDSLRMRIKGLSDERGRVMADAQTQAYNSARQKAKTEQANAVTLAELESSRERHKCVLKEFAEARWRLDECRTEIASLGDMIAETQDQLADLERQNEWLREAGSFLLERGKWWWRFMPLAWQRSKRNARLLRRGLFNQETYMGRYPDVGSSGQDPLRHFIRHGVAESRRYD